MTLLKHLNLVCSLCKLWTVELIHSLLMDSSMWILLRINEVPHILFPWSFLMVSGVSYIVFQCGTLVKRGESIVVKYIPYKWQKSKTVGRSQSTRLRLGSVSYIRMNRTEKDSCGWPSLTDRGLEQIPKAFDLILSRVTTPRLILLQKLPWDLRNDFHIHISVWRSGETGILMLLLLTEYVKTNYKDKIWDSLLK